MIRHQFYGWLDPVRGYLVSRYPPDAPVRPAISFETKGDVMVMVDKKRAKIMWWPPLPEEPRAHQS